MTSVYRICVNCASEGDLWMEIWIDIRHINFQYLQFRFVCLCVYIWTWRTYLAIQTQFDLFWYNNIFAFVYAINCARTHTHIRYTCQCIDASTHLALLILWLNSESFLFRLKLDIETGNGDRCNSLKSPEYLRI